MNGELKIHKDSNHIVITYIDKSFGVFGMGSATISNMNFLGNEEWFFNRLFVHEKMRNQGVGTMLMSELVRVLDEDKIVLVNEVNPYGDLDYNQLVSFYKKYGFVDMEIEGGLIRYPKN